MAASHRSMVPTIPGVPSWGAVLIAITFTAIGFAFDAGSGGKELTLVFAGAYVVGCIAAVLAVRQIGHLHRGHSATADPVRHRARRLLPLSRRHDGRPQGPAINCGYPLIERFPLMFFTSAIVLLIGMVRWYQGMSSRRAAPARRPRETEGLFSVGDVQDLRAADARTRGRGGRGARAAAQQAAFDRPGARQGAARRLRARREPAADDPSSAPSRRARGTLARRRPRSSSPSPSVPVDRAPPAGRPTRRFHRPSRAVGPGRRRAREPRKQPPPSERRSPYQRPDRHSRFDGFEPFEPHGTERIQRRSGSLNGTHHPVSRVRYRGADDGDQRPQYRARPRAVQASGRRLGVRRLDGV